MYYSKTLDFIFTRIGARTKTKKEKLHLTYYQLAGYENKSNFRQQIAINDFEKYDVSVIKSIASGKPYKKKNPNLIPDRYINRLTKKLEFKDEIELLWGDYKNDNFKKELFQKIIFDILAGNNGKQINFINNLLFDYVPYSKQHSLWQMFVISEIDMPKFPNNSKYSFSASFYGESEDEIINSYKKTQKDAINFLYYKCATNFNSILNDFIINEGKSFVGINKKMNNFIIALFEKLKKFLPNDDSLGMRVRNIMISDYQKFGELISRKIKGIPEDIESTIIKLLVESSLSYINNLARVQAVEYQVLEGQKLN